ncbi:MAG: hypothetical protein KDK44_04500 [Chlamydiia bacterium]|nr:hypothetical protein [Chlamydiia bacterium]
MNQVRQSALEAAKTPVKTYLSKQHNLQSDEHYKIVQIKDGTTVKQAQFFEKYGDKGHTLTYFMGNENIPTFVKEALIEPLTKTPEIAALGSRLNWKLTVNNYSQNSKERAGFPWHMDIPSNGDITAIITLISQGTLEVSAEKKPEVADATFHLIPGSMFLLSGEARWKCLHRVVPQKGASRLSLVLGCAPT